MKISEQIRQAQDEQCPEGFRWCPIQKKCLPGERPGLGRRAQQPPDIRETIKTFFKENPNPDDKQVHQLAAKLKVSPHDLETHIYALLSELLKE